MEVRAGYKVTELGVIPEDWAVKSVSQIADPVRGGSPRPAGDPKYFNGSFIPWLTVAALTNIPSCQLTVTETATCLTEEGSLRSRTLRQGTLLIANSGATLGVAKILGIKCCANDGIAALLRLSKDVSPYFLAHCINSKTDYLREVVATGNGQPNLNTQLIGRLQFPLPPTKTEQEAIAEALSNADALAESLEQLIAKKRHLKQGAARELLTGKRRLPSFSGKWEAKSVGELTDCTSGGTPSTLISKYWGGSIRWMSSGELNLRIVDEVEGRITEDGLRASSAKMIPEKCVLIGLAGQGKTRGTVAMNMVNLCTNQSIAAILPNNSFVPEYLYYNLDGRYKELRELSTGDGGRGGLNLTIIRSLAVPFPSLPEQTAIAGVLADMDAEIAALEAKLAKARQIKQGMAQNLLTGRIRLV
jgi:type I restriction enzyme S subunit